MAIRPVYLAIFGDVHGHLRLMFQLCRHWQLNSGIHLDGILVCGDLGFFPNVEQLDKATRRYVDRDPEELGFAHYFMLPSPLRQDPQLERTLCGDPNDLNTVRCRVVFCHGNHEDFEALQAITRGSVFSPVDFFKRVYYLRSGEVTQIRGVRVGALGGAPEEDDTVDAPVLSPVVSARAARRLRQKSFDILISHSGPHGVEGCVGSRLLAEVITHCQPAYNFYGHYIHFVPPMTIGRTQCFWHADVNFQRVKGAFVGPPEPGCMAVLCWRGTHDHDYSTVDAPWFREITARTWRHL